jgi:hypothetical protein
MHRTVASLNPLVFESGETKTQFIISMSTNAGANKIHKAKKRRIRKQKQTGHRMNETNDKFRSELHAEAIEHYFLTHPDAVKTFGTDSIKFATLFADNCIGALESTS